MEDQNGAGADSVEDLNVNNRDVTPSSPKKSPKEKTGSVPEKYKCPHFSRKCDFYTPCCDKKYKCRFCHDNNEDHGLTRDKVTQVVCSDCGTRQNIQQHCQNCNIAFGKYFCKLCKCFDDNDKKQFHCDGCLICRVGGRDNFFHCDGCGMCLPNSLKGNHTCRANISRADCPVCMEDIHTSKQYSRIPPCQHLIHVGCFDQLIANRMYNCPICCKSMLNMTPLWKVYDERIRLNPMSAKFQKAMAEILCRDCQAVTAVTYHYIGLKCPCGSYNTVRQKGPLYRVVEGVRQEISDPLETLTIPYIEANGTTESETCSQDDDRSTTPVPSDEEAGFGEVDGHNPGASPITTKKD